MKRILYEAEGGTSEGLKRVLERHGTKASVSGRQRKIKQIETGWVSCRRSG